MWLSSLPYAAAAAASRQSCPTLCNPIDGSPPGSPVPGILQARTLKWVAISFSNAQKWKVKVKSLSSVRLLATPWTVAYEAPPSMGFPRQEYWSGVPLPSPSLPYTTVEKTVPPPLNGLGILVKNHLNTYARIYFWLIYFILLNNLRYAGDTTLMAESKEEVKSLLMKVKEESEKVSLKLNIQKTKIMASSPITSWQIDGEIATDFIFWGSKITADGDCSHEIKRCLLPGRKVITNLDSIFKSRDTTFPTKVRLVKAVVFPVVMYGCESWTIKKAECRRIDAFGLWCWRRLFRVPWTARRSN